MTERKKAPAEPALFLWKGQEKTAPKGSGVERLEGFEPSHLVPETSALSPEL